MNTATRRVAIQQLVCDCRNVRPHCCAKRINGQQPGCRRFLHNGNRRGQVMSANFRNYCMQVASDTGQVAAATGRMAACARCIAGWPCTGSASPGPARPGPFGTAALPRQVSGVVQRNYADHDEADAGNVMQVLGVQIVCNEAAGQHTDARMQQSVLPTRQRTLCTC